MRLPREVVSPADHADTDFGRKAGRTVIAGAGVGGAIGTALGAVMAMIAATAVIAVPGVGLVAAGPVAAALAGAGAGALTGGLIGALMGLGMPEDRARLDDEGLKRDEGRERDGMVIGVTRRSDEDARFVEREWRNWPRRLGVVAEVTADVVTSIIQRFGLSDGRVPRRNTAGRSPPCPSQSSGRFGAASPEVPWRSAKCIVRP